MVKSKTGNISLEIVSDYEIKVLASVQWIENYEHMTNNTWNATNIIQMTTDDVGQRGLQRFHVGSNWYQNGIDVVWILKASHNTSKIRQVVQIISFTWWIVENRLKTAVPDGSTMEVT